MKKQNSFTFALLVLFAMVPFSIAPAFGGTIRSGQYYTWGIDTDNVAIHPGSVITEAVLTIHNLSSSSDNANDSLYIYLLDEPRVGFVADTDGGSSPFEERGVRMVQSHHEQSQSEQDVAYAFSELAVEPSPLWEHFGYPLVFGPDDQMVIESSLILDLIDYAGGGKSFGFGFDPNGNTDYDFNKITLDLTIESYTDEIEIPPITFTTIGQAGLIGHWLLDDNEPDTEVLDSSGNGNHGTAQQNTEDISTAGIIDGALTFNGTSDYIDCGNNSSLQIAGNLSISAWVRTSSGLRQFIVSKDDLINRSYSLFIVDGMIRFQIFENGTYYRIHSATSINDGTWHHVVGINDGTDLKVYIDGEFETLPGAGGIIDNKSADLCIGARSDLTYYFNGSIDGVRIFDNALSQAEVGILYNEGTAIVNHNPLIATIGDKSIEENQTLSFTVSASDPDGDNLTYSASNLHVVQALILRPGFSTGPHQMVMRDNIL